MSDSTRYRRLLAEGLAASYWRDYDKMVELEEKYPDEATQRQCRRGQLHYKTLALIYQDRCQKHK